MARTLGLNMLRLAEVALVETAKIERNRRWRADNSYALVAYSEEVVIEGLSLKRFRRFQGPALMAQFDCIVCKADSFSLICRRV